MQQVALLLLLSGASLRQGERQTGCVRSTLRRWRDWLHTRSVPFTFVLRSRWPELGRVPEPEFWPRAINEHTLAALMSELNHDLAVP